MIDEDTLNYLMTSEFNDKTPAELREHLLVMRKYVRQVHSSKKALDFKIDKLEKDAEYNGLLVKKLESNKVQAEKRADQYANRKVTFKDWILGKIINKQ